MSEIHNDEGSLGVGSLFSNGDSYKLVGCQHTKVILSRHGLPANILRVNAFAIGVVLARRMSVGPSARVTGRLETRSSGVTEALFIMDRSCVESRSLSF